MELEQRYGTKDCRQLRDAAGAHESRVQSEHEAIKGGEVGRTLTCAIADEQLMLEKERLCGDGSRTT